jgi:hypothetical protein
MSIYYEGYEKKSNILCIVIRILLSSKIIYFKILLAVNFFFNVFNYDLFGLKFSFASTSLFISIIFLLLFVV